MSLAIALARLLLVFAAGAGVAACSSIMEEDVRHSPRPVATPSAVAQEESGPAAERQRYLEQVRAAIAGRETLPADSVFENLEIFGRFPAERMLAVMDVGFGRSLGVSCTHCHDPENWSSDQKRPKRVAREMWAMMGRINGELLAGIPELDSERPIVNCTTCHRGALKPATDLSR